MKKPLDMTFDEFVSWATGYLLFEIGAGRRLRDIMFTILDMSTRNNVFGKEQKAREGK